MAVTYQKKSEVLTPDFPPFIPLVGDAPKAGITIEYKDGSTVEEKPNVVLPDGFPKLVPTDAKCTVGVDASRTFNLGNYNSVKVGVFLSVPCAAKDVEDVYNFVFGWVDQKMEKLADDIESAPKGDANV